jgi:hypothetical protein
MRSRRFSVAGTVSLSALVLGGCVFVAQPRPRADAGGHDQQAARVDPPGPQGGPPLVRTTHPVEPTPTTPATAPEAASASAPAQIRTGSHKYRYYPLTRVYFAPDRNRYYWLSARGWRVGNRLPKSISIKGEQFVIVKLDSDVPYLRHAAVEAAYPGPGHEEQISHVESSP